MPKYKSKEFLSDDSDASVSDGEERKDKKPKEKEEKKGGGKQKKEEPPAKKSRAEKKDEDEDCWEIGRNRKVKVNEFRGKKLIDIREYYEKDGQEFPGRKGISLSVEQWRAIIDIADQVDYALNRP